MKAFLREARPRGRIQFSSIQFSANYNNSYLNMLYIVTQYNRENKENLNNPTTHYEQALNK